MAIHYIIDAMGKEAIGEPGAIPRAAAPGSRNCDRKGQGPSKMIGICAKMFCNIFLLFFRSEAKRNWSEHARGAASKSCCDAAAKLRPRCGNAVFALQQPRQGPG